MKFICTLLVLVSAVLLAGCGDPSGGGSGSIDGRVMAYGVGEKGITFAIFTDMPSVDTKANAGGESGIAASTQSGSISPASGLRLDYRAGSDFVEISGAKYMFGQGRVFVVTSVEGRRDIKQLNIPIQPSSLSPGDLRGEMRRLSGTPEVLSAMNGSEQKTP